MEFKILGPLEAWDQGRRVPLGPPQQQAVLAVLLLNAGRVVSVDRLVDELWSDAPPATVGAVLQVYVSRLRRALRGGQDPATQRPLLLTERPGYRLLVSPDQVDANRFERLVERGRRALADDEPEQAAATLRQALALWHGPALADLAAKLTRQTMTARLDEGRVAALEDRIDADLGCGRHHQLVGELVELAARHPLRERLHAQLMLALYRSGRHAEALGVYRDTRRELVENFGVEPGAELQRLQRAVLVADPTLEWRPPRHQRGRRTPPAAPVPPRHLPPDITTFTGRREELDRLCDLLTSKRATPVSISAVDGTAGIGKSALAIHAAHRVAAGFLDGQLYADLHGSTAGLAPREPSEVLARFLRSLGVDGKHVPTDLEEASAMFRSLMADRQLLVLLDNAASAAQIRPLLPAAPGCGVLVTSRQVLGALDDAVHLHLDVLAPAEAEDLLARISGPARIAAEPEAAATVARLCGGLPLALRIAGAKLAIRPHWSIAHLAERLADERRRLDELRAADLDVRAAFMVSYEGCTGEQRRALRLLGLLDAPDFAGWVLAALLDIPVDAAEDLAERLVDTRLLEVAGGGPARYRFHDLLRLYARERAHAEEPEAGRAAALERALGAWLTLAEHANAQLHPGGLRRPIDGVVARPPDPGAVAAAERDPLGWFEREHAALVAACGQAHAGQHAALTCALAAALAGYFGAHSHWEDWQRTHELALDAARRAGNRRAEASMLRGLGDLRQEQARWEEAVACHQEALLVFADLDDQHQQAATLYALGEAYRDLCRDEEALDCYRRAMPVAAAVGDRHLQASTQLSQGIVRRDQGRLDQAVTCYVEALAILRTLGDRRCQAGALNSLGIARREQGRHAEAVACYEEALALLVALGDRRWQAALLRNLGVVHDDQGRAGEAVACYEEALAVFRTVGDRRWQAGTLLSLGDTHRAQGRFEPAGACYEEALATCRELGERRGEAATLDSLGQLHHDQRRFDDAARCYRQALATFQEIGARLREAELLERLGAALAAGGDQPAATAARRGAMAIRQELATPRAVPERH
jgi:DNA-binding SARP family transcriptional activator/tetratricopeptide (TPR) repeat protein